VDVALPELADAELAQLIAVSARLPVERRAAFVRLVAAALAAGEISIREQAFGEVISTASSRRANAHHAAAGELSWADPFRKSQSTPCQMPRVFIYLE
jgi:hypothetical protein